MSIAPSTKSGELAEAWRALEAVKDPEIPVISVVIAAFFMPKVPAEGAIAAIVFHIPAYALVTFVWDTGVHFIHLYAVLFTLEIGIMWVAGRVWPRAQTPTTLRPPIDMTPWRWSKWVSGGLALSVVAIYWLFSPLGLA